MKRIIFVPVLQLIGMVVCAQPTYESSTRDHFKMPNIAPQSPSVASIEKFGNIPVSYSTGATSISVPIYTATCGDISWPFSLSYHSGGIRVEEVASNIGLGWAMTGEAVITRSIAGRPDEENSEPYYDTIKGSEYDYLIAAAKGYADTEHDVYNYTINGRSGKFLIKQNGAVFQIPVTNLKITYDASGFVIVDETGMIYTFNRKDEGGSFNGGVSVGGTVAWRMTKVQTPDKKQSIDFSYENGGQSYHSSSSYTQSVGYRFGTPSGGVGTIPPIDFSADGNPVESTSSSNVNFSQITRVDFPNGYLTLTYANDRADVSASFNSRITQVKVYTSYSRLIKEFNLHHSYFSPSTSRLKLDSVTERVVNPGAYKTYSFEYNATEMPAVNSKAQDMWGFYNGVNANTSLLQIQEVTYNFSTYTVGNAFRNTDTVKMKTGLLTAVNWPTGGRTEFTYDAHQYATGAGTYNYQSINTRASGNGNYTATSTFTMGMDAPGLAHIKGDISRYDFPGVTGVPYIQVKDLTIDSVIFYARNDYPESSYGINEPLRTPVGHTFEVKAFVFTNTEISMLTAGLNITWPEYTEAVNVEKGGGVRVRQIKNFSRPGELAGTEYYEYSPGITTTPFQFINKKVTRVYTRKGHDDGTGCEDWFYEVPTVIAHSGSAYAISTAVGAPLLYPMVTKYELDGSGASKGKTVYEYDVIQDEANAVFENYRAFFTFNDWQSGVLRSESVYNRSGGTYQLIKRTDNTYGVFRGAATGNLQVRYRHINSGCFGKENFLSEYVTKYIQFTNVAITTGVKKLMKSVVTEYDNGGGQLKNTTVNFYKYDAPHDFPIKTYLIDSKGDTITTTLKYPVDFSATGNVYEKMITANLISPVIERKVFKGLNVSPSLLSTVTTSFKDWKSDGLVLAVDTVKGSVFSNPPESKLVFTNYNDRKQPLEVKKEAGKTMAYIYDYNYQHPIAEVANAAQSQIAYTSFEADGKGNWTYSGTPVRDLSSPTGKMCYSLGSVSKTGLSSGVTYLVSYWKKSGTVDVHSTTAVAGRTVNGWTYYEHKVSGRTSISVAGAGTTYIDELRLYPASNVLMTTYTYDPLIGMTSQCDANNRISYYEYDELQRLIMIRDQDRNILKKFAYNYSGQPEYPNVYYNIAKSGNAQRTGCSGCLTGSVVTYTVPANMYLSTVSTAAANQMAQNDVDSNKVAYAQANGNCITPPNATLLLTNTVPVQINFYNICTGVTYNRTYASANGGFPIGSIPEGRYNIEFIISASGNFTFASGGLYISGSGSSPKTIYDVLYTPGTNTISITPTP